MWIWETFFIAHFSIQQPLILPSNYHAGHHVIRHKCTFETKMFLICLEKICNTYVNDHSSHILWHRKQSTIKRTWQTQFQIGANSILTWCHYPSWWHLRPQLSTVSQPALKLSLVGSLKSLKSTASAEWRSDFMLQKLNFSLGVLDSSSGMDAS